MSDTGSVLSPVRAFRPGEAAGLMRLLSNEAQVAGALSPE